MLVPFGGNLLDLNATLLWLVGFSTLGMVLNLRHVPMRHALPMLVGVAIVACSFLVFITLAFPVAGYLILLVWFLALALPAHLSNRLFRALTLQRYDFARKLLWWLRILQPTQQHRQQFLLYQAYHLAHLRNDPAPLLDLITIPGNIGVLARLFAFRFRGAWDEALQWMSQPHLLHAYSGNIIFLQHHFRALAEVAGARTALERMRLLEPLLLKRGLYMQRTLLRAEVLAYFGRRDQLELLLTTSLKHTPMAWQTFMLGLCNWAQGNLRAARDAYHQLDMVNADPCYTATLRNKLDRGHLLSRTLPTPAETKMLDDLSQNAAQLATDPWGWQRGNVRTWVAYGLIAANVTFFVMAELFGGSTNPEVLMRLGSLWPEAVIQGQYWRLLTAMFLHLGFLHLALNMYFLYFLAGFLEPRLGRLPFFVIYMGSGLIAGAISCVWHYFSDPLVQSVGASGAVLGLLGSFAAVRLQTWLQHHEIGAKRQLTLVLILLSLQVFYDLMTPISNGAVHLLGAISGFALTYLWLAWSQDHSQPETHSHGLP